MERLTVRNDEGIGVLRHPFACERCGDICWSLPDLGDGSPTDRLARYEDIGLLPEQLMEIDKLYTEKCEELAKLQREYLSGMELLEIYVGLEQLKKYKCLEEQCIKENGVGIEMMLMKFSEFKTDVHELCGYEELEEQGKMTDMQKKALKLKEDIERACIENGLNLTIYDEKIGFVDHKEGKRIILWEPVYSDHD